MFLTPETSRFLIPALFWVVAFIGVRGGLHIVKHLRWLLSRQTDEVNQNRRAYYMALVFDILAILFWLGAGIGAFIAGLIGFINAIFR